MDLKGIITVSGKPGLYKIITNTKSGLIVNSLQDGKRIPVYSTQNVSALDEISIYTKTDDIPLKDVMQKLYQAYDGKEGPGLKESVDKLRDKLSDVVEDCDHSRIYNSDLKKVFKWYNILLESKMLEVVEEDKDKSVEDDKESSAEEKTKDNSEQEENSDDSADSENNKT